MAPHIPKKGGGGVVSRLNLFETSEGVYRPPIPITALATTQPMKARTPSTLSQTGAPA